MPIIRWLSIICLIIFTNCDREIPLPNLEVEPVMVADFTFNPDAIWQLYLTQSTTLVNADTLLFIPDAEVIVENLKTGEKISLGYDGNGFYSAKNTFPLSNTPYSFTASANGLHTITAQSQSPLPFSIELNGFSTFQYRGRDNYQFEFTINDNPTEDNFYLIEIQYNLLINDTLHTAKAGHFSQDSNSDNERIEIDHDSLNQSYLLDHTFNGQAYTTEVSGNSYLLKELPKASSAHAIISIKSINRAGYDYAKSIESFLINVESLVLEPDAILSNIENGLGVFAGFTEQRIEVQLK